MNVPLRLRLSFFVLLVSCSAAIAAPDEARFMACPDIHKDKIVFSYEGDLWLTSDGGGAATRLTTAPGSEDWPRFSPDGRWIAFIGSYDGEPAVYRIPAAGGEPERISYLPGASKVVAWSQDGQRVLFCSMQGQINQREPALYSVGVDGTAPERLPMDSGSYCTFAPDGRQLVYNRHGYIPANWKRYKGGAHSDIWSYDFNTKKYEALTSHVGKNAFPMWIGGKVYYISDQFGPTANLCALSLETRAITPVTRHETFDVMEPASDGKRIVYLQNGYLHVLEPGSGETRQLAVTVPTDRWQIRSRAINPSDSIRGMDVANDGKTAVLEARGDIFTIPVSVKGQTRNLSQDCGSREMHPRISPDGKQVAFFSDRTGDYQLYTQPTGGGAWTQRTRTLDCLPYRPAWSPDGRKILFGCKDLALYVYDLGKDQITKINESRQLSNDEFFWEMDDYGWAPDSNWICFSNITGNRNGQIFIYSLEQQKKFAVTDDFYHNLKPSFDQNGDNLYFLSSRSFDVQMDFYEDNHVIANPFQVMAVQLRAGQKPLFADDEETSESKAGDKKGEMKGATATRATGTTQSTPLRIDTGDFARRTFALPVPAGNYYYLRAGKGKVLWCARPDFGDSDYEQMFKPGGGSDLALHIFDVKGRKDAVLEDKIRDYALSTNGEQAIVAAGRDYTVASLDKLSQTKKVGGSLNLGGMLYRFEPVKEWTQIFNDAWRWYRDFFYDTKMNGQDWKVIGERYRAMIPQLSSRERLNWLMTEMVGELCCSHAYISGGDMGPLKAPDSPLYTGLLGADLAWDEATGRYRLARIYGPTKYNTALSAPLARPDVEVKEGDYLLAIDGKPLLGRADYYRLLQVTSGQKVSVTVSADPTTQSAKTYEVTPLRSDRMLRYNRWVTDKIAQVDKASGGRLGYMHITAMDDSGIGQFDKFWRAFRNREGLVVDVRCNNGGYTEYFLIDKLERQQVGFNLIRNMTPMRYPGSVGRQRYAEIVNEYTASDGELFTEHFKARKLGPVIGKPTWGGLVGILNAQRTVDGGIIQQPNNAFYGREGKWWVENHGADPDIVLDNDPAAFQEGRDPQLEKAIQVLLEQIEKDKTDKTKAFPPRPAYPKR